MRILKSILSKPNDSFLANSDQRRFYKHLKSTAGMGGAKATSKQFIRDEVDTLLLRDRVQIRERWSRFYHKLFNTKSLTLDPTTIDLFPPRPLKVSLGRDEPHSWTRSRKHLRACQIGRLLGQMLPRPNS